MTPDDLIDKLLFDMVHKPKQVGVSALVDKCSGCGVNILWEETTIVDDRRSPHELLFCDSCLDDYLLHDLRRPDYDD